MESRYDQQETPLDQHRRPNDGPEERWANGLQWWVLSWIALIHVGALAAPFAISWQAVVTAILLSWVTGGLGICLGYHRLLTHGSFQTYRWMRRILACLGTLAGEGPPINWVAMHRKHHQFSDQQGDPHSPRDGAWWSHMIWLFPRPEDAQWRQTVDRYAPDLLKDPFMPFLDRTFLAWHVGLGLLLLGLGCYAWGPAVGVSMVVWGMFVRLIYVLHITWLVNSASHMWGYRNYQTPDNSRNLWWVGLLAYGEGWHNNHHAFQRSARHGHRWWEIDLTYLAILALASLGLAWNVVLPPRNGPDGGGRPETQ